MGIKFHPIFEPRDLGQGVAPSDTEEHNLVSQDILEVEMRRLRYSRSLECK